MRSRPAELLVNDASEEEIRDALIPDFVDPLHAAKRGIDAEMVCAADHEHFEDALTLELSKYLALCAGSWSPEQRAEWLGVATEELGEYPLSMLLPTLKRARRSEPWPNKLVANIAEQLEPRYQKLKGEAEIIGKLLELVK